MRRVLTFIMAGGKGERLHPLTRDRAKPAVPFGGSYRIIDFTLSNCINSGLRRIFIASQYKAQSLNRHVRTGWSGLGSELGEFVEVLPPQKGRQAVARVAPKFSDGFRTPHDRCPHRAWAPDRTGDSGL